VTVRSDLLDPGARAAASADSRFNHTVRAPAVVIAARPRRQRSRFGRGDKPHRRWKRRCAASSRSYTPTPLLFKNSCSWRRSGVCRASLRCGDPLCHDGFQSAVCLRCVAAARCCGPVAMGRCCLVSIRPALQSSCASRSRVFIWATQLGRKRRNLPRPEHLIEAGQTVSANIDFYPLRSVRLLLGKAGAPEARPGGLPDGEAVPHPTTREA